MELSIAYELTGPDGTRAVVGNGDAALADPDFCGFLDPDNGITGLLDGADVRDNGQVVPQAHGGQQGPNYLGFRPGTIQGFADPNTDLTVQELAIARLKKVSRALDADGVLRWTPTVDGIRRRMRYRRTARGSFPGRRPKTFQLALSSPDPYVFSDAEQSQELALGAAGELGIPDPIADPITSELALSAQNLIHNAGDAETWPRLRIDGPVTNPQILNQTTGQRIVLAYTLQAGEWLDVYPQRGQILLGGTADRYDAYVFEQSAWWQLVDGDNDVRVLAAAYAAPAKVTVFWRHAWE